MTKANEDKKINDILHARALQLAKSKTDTEIVQSSTILVFHVGENEKYAIPYHNVERVERINNIRTIPKLDPLFLGITYLNSEVCAVVNCANMLNIKSEEVYKPEFIILLTQDNVSIALASNTILGLIPFEKNQKLTHFDTDDGRDVALIDGVYQTDITLINLNKTFNYIKNYTLI